MNARIYIEGGGDSKDMHSRCRQGFRRLLEACGFSGCMPRLVACGGREATFEAFKTAHRHAGAGDYVAMLVDSEDLVCDIEKPWEHLRNRDEWAKPAAADDEQVLLMVTCTETWIVADRVTLRSHYGSSLQVTSLPALNSMESRDRHSVQDALVNATRSCTNAYAKGKRSFEILGKLNPSELEARLPSFARCKRVLEAKL